jgi:hypothetical protein
MDDSGCIVGSTHHGPCHLVAPLPNNEAAAFVPRVAIKGGRCVRCLKEISPEEVARRGSTMLHDGCRITTRGLTEALVIENLENGGPKAPPEPFQTPPTVRLYPGAVEGPSPLTPTGDGLAAKLSEAEQKIVRLTKSRNDADNAHIACDRANMEGMRVQRDQIAMLEQRRDEIAAKLAEAEQTISSLRDTVAAQRKSLEEAVASHSACDEASVAGAKAQREVIANLEAELVAANKMRQDADRERRAALDRAEEALRTADLGPLSARIEAYGRKVDDQGAEIKGLLAAATTVRRDGYDFLMLLEEMISVRKQTHIGGNQCVSLGVINPLLKGYRAILDAGGPALDRPTPTESDGDHRAALRRAHEMIIESRGIFAPWSDMDRDLLTMSLSAGVGVLAARFSNETGTGVPQPIEPDDLGRIRTLVYLIGACIGIDDEDAFREYADSIDIAANEDEDGGTHTDGFGG